MKIIIKMLLFYLVIGSYCNAQNLNRYIKDGLNSADEKKYIQAIESFTKALNIDSNYSEVYCHRGLAKFEIQDYYGAIKDFEKILKIGHSDERYIFLSLYTLGLSNFNINKYDKSIYYLDSALTLRPNNSDIYLERGKAKINMGEIEKGCYDFSKAGDFGNKEAYDFIQKYCVNSVLYEKEINWIKYGETIYFNTYYDPNIIQESDYIFQIATKQVINDKNYEEAKQVIFGESNGIKYRNMKYILVRYNININNGKTRKVNAAVYNRDNTLIEKHDFDKVYKYLDSEGWQIPIKNSTEASLVKVINKKYNK